MDALNDSNLDSAMVLVRHPFAWLSLISQRAIVLTVWEDLNHRPWRHPSQHRKGTSHHTAGPSSPAVQQTWLLFTHHETRGLRQSLHGIRESDLDGMAYGIWD